MGTVDCKRSAEPDLDVLALLPCFEMRRREEARIEEVVLILKVWWESPPVPTMSHCIIVSQMTRILGTCAA